MCDDQVHEHAANGHEGSIERGQGALEPEEHQGGEVGGSERAVADAEAEVAGQREGRPHDPPVPGCSARTQRNPPMR